jgi:Domain of unknown function (DUF1918)
MDLTEGATIVAESEKASQAARTGVIEKVLQENPPRVRVRWSDGRISVLTPADGAVRVAQPAPPGKARAKR